MPRGRDKDVRTAMMAFAYASYALFEKLDIQERMHNEHPETDMPVELGKEIEEGLAAWHVFQDAIRQQRIKKTKVKVKMEW